MSPSGSESPAQGAGTEPLSGSEDTVPHTPDPNQGERVAATDYSGTLLAGRYRLLDKLGAGGMGSVYRAEHVDIHKRVAIKLLEVSSRPNASAVDRFMREARAASRIEHPNIVDITDFGFTDEEVPFFAMELLEGEDLSKTLRARGRLPWPRVRAIMLQVLAALEAAHAGGIIHRDIKPSNCLRVRREAEGDFIKVVDFGLAKVIDEDPEHQSLTRTGAVMGTVHYMSPEQARSERLDARTDVYSAGVLAFELLTGSVPYWAPGFMGVLAKLATAKVPALSDAAPEVEFNDQLERVIKRAMAKDRDDRYASAAEFARALEQIPADASTSAPARPVPIALGALVVGLGIGGLALAFGGRGAASAEPETLAAAAAPAEPEPPATADKAQPQAQVEPAPAPAEPEPAPDEAPVPPEPAATADEAPAPEPPTAPVLSEPRSKPKSSAKADKPEPSPKPSPDPPAELPQTLSRADMKTALAKAKAGAKACSAEHGATLPTVKIKFEVGPDGAVESAAALAPMTGMAVGICAAKALAEQRFPRSVDGVSDVVSLPL